MMETGFNDRIGRPPSMSRGRATPVAAFRKTSTYLDGTRRENAFSGVLLLGREIYAIFSHPRFSSSAFIFDYYLSFIFWIRKLSRINLARRIIIVSE